MRTANASMKASRSTSRRRIPTPASRCSSCRGTAAPVVMQALLGACLDAGARLAEPGEFTRRAFLEGKLDLAQAEAVADLIDAASREAARSALRSLARRVLDRDRRHAPRSSSSCARSPRRCSIFRRRTSTRCIATTQPRASRACARRSTRCWRKSRQGSLLRSGIHVVLAGRPNVGKSSLLNRLAGEERAIVTPIPGTTRDALREPIQIEGVPLVVVDTAGLRVSTRRGRAPRHRAHAARARARGPGAGGVRGRRAAAALEGLPAAAARASTSTTRSICAPGFRPPPAAQRASRCRRRPAKGIDSAAQGDSRGSRLGRRPASRCSSRASATCARCEAARGASRGRRARVAALGAVRGGTAPCAGRARQRSAGEFTADDLLGEIFARFCIGK